VSIEIANESGVAVESDQVLAVARYVLDEMGVNPLAELSVLLVDIEYMTELNHRWMGGDGPTDVLAFPMEESSVDHGPSESPGEPLELKLTKLKRRMVRTFLPNRPRSSCQKLGDAADMVTQLIIFEANEKKLQEDEEKQTGEKRAEIAKHLRIAEPAKVMAA